MKLRSNQLTAEEASELNTAFLEQQAEAKKKNDVTSLIALALGLALLAGLLRER